MSRIADRYGIEYVLGETNSISCQSRDLVSNVFGTALWYLDYTLYIASSTQVAKMYFHQGTPYRYSLWAPYIGASSNSALVRPSYYGALMLATVLGGNGSKKQVHPVLEEEISTAYSPYADGELDSLVILNNEPYNVSLSTPRPEAEITLPARIKVPGKIRRLTVPGSDVKDGMTFAGQKVDESGKITGDEVVEDWTLGDVVKVRDSEGVLITFGKRAIPPR